MDEKKEKIKSGFKKNLYIVLGSICFGLGLTGAIISFLPTTPLLLLAGFFYIRSSQKLYDWMMNHKVFGTFLTNYIEKRALTKRMRIWILTGLWTTLIVSSIAANSPGGNFILLIIGVGFTIHLSFFDILKEDKKGE